MYLDLTDEQLVERAVGHDPNAFGEIVRRWERKIFALCFGMLGREDDARDAAQEAFVKAFQSIAGFKGSASFRTWILRIAENLCRDRLRARQARRAESLEFGWPWFRSPR